MDLRYLQVPFPLHLFEQQSELDEQLSPRNPHDGQAASPLQSESLQSLLPSQSLSIPSVHVEPGISFDGGVPQSRAQ